MYSSNFIDPSRRELKRDITPIEDDLTKLVMSDIKNIKPSFYKYNEETDFLEKGNESKYRPNMHLGVIVDESPDYIQDNAFSGIDIYALATMTLVGVKYNYEELEYIKTTITDFGSVQINGKEIKINFNEEFRAKLNENDMPVITITPYAPNVDLYIAYKDSEGFIVKSENDVSINFDWIAIAKINSSNSTDDNKNIDNKLLEQLVIPDSKKGTIKSMFNPD
jgi:hypothetical protein